MFDINNAFNILNMFSKQISQVPGPFCGPGCAGMSGGARGSAGILRNVYFEHIKHNKQIYVIELILFALISFGASYGVMRNKFNVLNVVWIYLTYKNIYLMCVIRWKRQSRKSPGHICICMCIYACVWFYMCVYVNACIFVFLYIYIYVCMYLCMYVCMYVRMYVCMYVCM